MNFEQCLAVGKSKKVSINKIRAMNILKSSSQAIETAKLIPLSEKTMKTIVRELYEGLREYCEAIGFLYGYKFLDHESITYFLQDVAKEESISKRFDRYRKLRNGINYYGEEINIETAKEASLEIPELIKKLEKYTNAEGAK